MLPGLADRIVAMAERDQAHEINVRDMAFRADIRHRDETLEAQRDQQRGVFISDALGQVCGAVIAGGAVFGAVYAAVNGAHWTVSVALVGLPIAAIVKALRSPSQASDRKKR